jgi:hypothetical protein
MLASSAWRQGFASPPALVNLASGRAIRPPFQRLRYHVITPFHQVITRLKDVITNWFFRRFRRLAADLPFGARA